MVNTRGHEAVIEALRAADYSLVLTGLRLGADHGSGRASAHVEWSRRASIEAYLTDPTRFWEYYYPAALSIAERTPAPAHVALAQLQDRGAIQALVTQAVDRLHARTGSTDVVEVYGSVLVYCCRRCDERYGLPELGALIERSGDGIPRCDSPDCGYPLRPEGTLWGEPLPENAVRRAWELAARADCVLVVDSDLRTAPISLLPSVPLTHGATLIIIGSEPTQYDRYAQHVLREPSSDLLCNVAAAFGP
jgi:NAD-dependent deacetylase